MGELFEGEDDIRDLFKQMLGSDIIIKDNIKENEEKLFILLFVEQLEKAKDLEDKTINIGLDVHSFSRSSLDSNRKYVKTTIWVRYN